ncbi:MAG: metal ABC transporter permease [Ignavibacteriae bacterium]|nr:metal ABC transporter permease [Ignavibacteriota bacterium]
MTELLGYAFMQKALLVAMLVGGVCALIGVYVVLNGLSFIGAGISHSAFGGVALGLALGVDPLLAALVFSVGTALSIGAVSERGEIKKDTAVGIFFAATMALGIAVISTMKGFYTDLFGYLFGNILAVTAGDIIWSAALTFVILGIVALYWKELLALSFDAEHARVMGLPTRLLSYLLLALMAVTIVISVKSVGVVLVSALIVTPAASAYQLTRRFGWMMTLSVLFGIGASVGGLLLAYQFNMPSGATIVLLATALFVLAWLLSPRRRR